MHHLQVQILNIKGTANMVRQASILTDQGDISVVQRSTELPQGAGQVDYLIHLHLAHQVCD